MTFDESYGELPSRTLSLIRRYNVSPADYDTMLRVLGYRWDSPNIPFMLVNRMIEQASQGGSYRPSRFL